MSCFLTLDIDVLIGIGMPFTYKILSSGSSVSVSKFPLDSSVRMIRAFQHIFGKFLSSDTFFVVCAHFVFSDFLRTQ